MMCLIGAFKALAENDAKNKFLSYVEKSKDSTQSATKAFSIFLFIFYRDCTNDSYCVVCATTFSTGDASALIEWDKNMVHTISPQFSLIGKEE